MNRKVTFITYSEDRWNRKKGKYRETQENVAKVLKTHPNVKSILSYTLEDLKLNPDFIRNRNFFSGNTRRDTGWAFKSLIISQSLSNMSDNEFLLYHDVSPEIWQKDNYNDVLLDLHIESCEANNGITLGAFKAIFRQGHTHRRWTSPTVLEALRMENFADEIQWCASWILLKNTQYIRELIEEWKTLNLTPELASLQHHKEFDHKIEPEFIEHRGDQSLITLLMLREGLTNVFTGTRGKNCFSLHQQTNSQVTGLKLLF